MIEIKIIFIFYIFMNGNSVYVYEQKSIVNKVASSVALGPVCLTLGNTVISLVVGVCVISNIIL